MTSALAAFDADAKRRHLVDRLADRQLHAVLDDVPEVLTLEVLHHHVRATSSSTCREARLQTRSGFPEAAHSMTTGCCLDYSWRW
jgi:hypothetical protein